MYKGFVGKVVTYMSRVTEPDEVDAIVEKYHWGWCRHIHKSYHVPKGSIEVTGKVSDEKVVLVVQTTADEFVVVYEDGDKTENMSWKAIDNQFRVESVKRTLLFESGYKD